MKNHPNKDSHYHHDSFLRALHSDALSLVNSHPHVNQLGNAINVLSKPIIEWTPITPLVAQPHSLSVLAGWSLGKQWMFSGLCSRVRCRAVGTRETAVVALDEPAGRRGEDAAMTRAWQEEWGHPPLRTSQPSGATRCRRRGSHPPATRTSSVCSLGTIPPGNETKSAETSHQRNVCNTCLPQQGQEEESDRIRDAAEEVHQEAKVLQGVRSREDHKGVGLELESAGGWRALGGVRGPRGAEGPARASRAREAARGHLQAGPLYALRLQALHGRWSRLPGSLLPRS